MRAAKIFSVLVVLSAAAGVRAQQIDGPLNVPLPLFPPSNWWNLDISQAPMDNGSGNFINHIGGGTPLHPDFGPEESPGSVNIYGFPYVIVHANQPKRAVQFLYSDESDGVDHNTDTSFPFYPIPDEAITQPHWIEGGEPGQEDPGGDRHMLIVDVDNNYLYELYALHWNGSGWEGGSGAFFDMNTDDRRPDGWTSADAAGLAILPGLVRYDEVYGPNEIDHAFRFTVQNSNSYVFPASHDAGSTPGALPMGARLRLHEAVQISGPPEIQKIVRAMKKYGLIVADNGSNMYISGTFDLGWDNDILNPAFGSLHASDFDVVQLGFQGSTTADVSITKDDGLTTVQRGQSVSYTMTVTNAGPGAVSNVAVADHFGADFDSASWTCSAPYASHCGALTGSFPNLGELVSLAPGATATITAVALTNTSADGTLSNTATASVPTAFTDPNASNNSATDVDTVIPEADLVVAKSDGSLTATPGQPVTWTITATNQGPDNVPSASLTDTFPSSISGVTWACAAPATSSCGAPTGSGNIAQSVSIAVGDVVTFTATGLLSAGATGTLSNTAGVTAAGGVVDPLMANNSATDLDNVSLSPMSELVTGSRSVLSLAAAPGPLATTDWFRIRQEALSSYEILVDGTSADLGAAGPSLQRLAGNAVSVIQTSVGVGTGSARSLRFANAGGAVVDDQLIRVQSAGCTTTCGPEDVYGIRAYDTTYSVSRFNNSGTQVTVLLLENTADHAVSGVVWLLASGGSLRASQVFSVPSHGAFVFNTSGLAPSSSGTIRVTNDGRYGDLSGKTVALEPATGFTFDTLLLSKAN
jgi:uncharacterized repeat protein (TIGR01451 family)